jgi:preprotein translocase subunit SecD
VLYHKVDYITFFEYNFLWIIVIIAIILSLIHDFCILQYYEWSHHVKQHRKNKIKRIKKVVQKKKIKMISIEKKRFHMKKTINRGKKRKKAKIIKRLEKTSKFKRVYNKRLLHSSISEQKSSISVQTSTILKNSILSIKKIETQSFTSSWKDYVYE